MIEDEIGIPQRAEGYRHRPRAGSVDALAGIMLAPAKNIAQRRESHIDRRIVRDAIGVAFGETAIDIRETFVKIRSACARVIIENLIIDLRTNLEGRQWIRRSGRGDWRIKSRRNGAERRVYAKQMQHRRRFVRLEVIPDGGVFNPFDRLQQQRNAVAVLVNIVKILAAAEVLVEAVAATDLSRQAQRNLVLNDGDIHYTLERTVILTTVGAAKIAADITTQARQFRGNHHRTAHRIATEQGTLRAFQYLDIGDIESGNVGAGTRQRDIRKIGNDRGHAFAQWNLGEARHRDVVVGPAPLGTAAKARYPGVQILDWTHVPLL